jgi:hypothetical protein
METAATHRGRAAFREVCGGVSWMLDPGVFANGGERLLLLGYELAKRCAAVSDG